ncbi:GTP pyrophosphokinase [Radiobacillus deserti]|uniref:GTP pyrophosphokinase family protein n=1 Tax=Radiobacillus deserti TaxID=2594883 RepID=A0A516KEU3_9BACI|nr:GTP pyrophosphokinase family protein [Radiobacillus deserti]QDP39836.1 GTP pyrophosphokinase family protein [Radiobacillus deserti]
MSLLSQNYLSQFKDAINELTRFTMVYKFAMDELNTKINILQEEFQYVHDYNPIEHCSSRLKSPESILQKVIRKNIDFSLPEIKENIKDIAGIRISCSFISDIYRISEMIENQKDVELVDRKDYIKNPKPNGYQSLHLILKIPVFMSDREEEVYVELQIRTIAMDFWASLEHKIFYKYNKDIPDRLKKDLKDAAFSAAELDKKMESIHKEVNQLKKVNEEEELGDLLSLDLPKNMMQSILKDLNGSLKLLE